MIVRRLAMSGLAACLALPALAESLATTPAAIPGGPVAVSVSYAINEPLASTDPATVAAADAAHRQVLLLRAEGECAAFLATIATDCAVSGITLSTQVNSYPGQPPTLYVSSTVSLQVTLRKAAD